METYNRIDKYIITHQLTNMAHLEIFLSFLITIKST